ncbi:MAG TPA: winged helix-turn-helix domain-containing protein, partial [Rhizobacter sp.]
FGAVLLEGEPEHLELSLGWLQMQAHAQTAIVIVGAGGAAAIADALTRGADDYVFSDGDVAYATQRIIARIGARTERRRRTVLRSGNVELNALSGEIGSAGARVRLTTRETRLARLLFESPGRVVALDRLCLELCGTNDATAVRSVNQHVYQLRRKLDRLPAEGERVRIEALYGTGYRLAR